MNIFQSMLGSSDAAAVKQLASQFGLSPEQASAAAGALLPAVAAGLKRNLSNDASAAQLESALAAGRHQSYVEQPEVLANPETVTDGNAILGHIFGGKEVSRQVATNASQKTGIDPAILKKCFLSSLQSRWVDWPNSHGPVPAGLAAEAESARCSNRCSIAIVMDRPWMTWPE